MTIMIEDWQTERLVQQLASAQGVNTGDVVRENVLALAKMRGLVTAQAPLRQRLAKLADAIYVLHCFQKKSQQTAKPDIDLANKRYRELLQELEK